MSGVVPTELWWSPSTETAQGWGLHYSKTDGVFVRPATLPDDAVRLVPEDETLADRERRVREALPDDDEDDDHGPWFYMEGGVLCHCRYTVDQNERCTRPRTPEGIEAERTGALFEAADNLLHERREGRPVRQSHYDDLQTALDALSELAVDQ